MSRSVGQPRRRLAALMLAALGSSIGLPVVRAQKSGTPRVAVLLITAPRDGDLAQQFRKGLVDAGLAEGRDVVLDWRSAGGDFAKVRGIVEEIVRSRPDIIVVETTRAAQAVKQATSTIPVVLTIVSDPVGSGLVGSLSHPGANITGMSAMATDLTAKRLQLLKEALPRLTRVAVLWSPEVQSHQIVLDDLRRTAPGLNIELALVSARSEQELNHVVAQAAQARAQALYILDNAAFAFHRRSILDQAMKARMPVFGDRAFAESGALLAYGASFADLYRRAASYVDRILKGAKPGDLPIEQASRFELVVNLTVARALGISLPESILQRADEVIR